MNAPHSEPALPPKEAMNHFLGLANRRPLNDQELEQLNAHVPGLDATLGIRYSAVSNGEVRAYLRVNGSHMQPWGMVNGGVYCSLAESVGSLAGVIAAGRPAVGVNNDTNFIKGVTSGVIEAVGTPIHLGGSQHLWNIDMFNNGALVARSQLRLYLLNA